MTHHHEKVTDANFTFVAIDETGIPRPIPQDRIEA
jgi:acyl-CoA hydrolase